MPTPNPDFAMEADQPHAIDVIASGIHDAKNSMFDALARIGVAIQAIHEGRAAAALPAAPKGAVQISTPSGKTAQAKFE